MRAWFAGGLQGPRPRLCARQALDTRLADLPVLGHASMVFRTGLQPCAQSFPWLVPPPWPETPLLASWPSCTSTSQHPACTVPTRLCTPSARVPRRPGARRHAVPHLRRRRRRRRAAVEQGTGQGGAGARRGSAGGEGAWVATRGIAVLLYAGTPEHAHVRWHRS